MSSISVQPTSSWISTNEHSRDPSLTMAASIMGLTMALNDFASAQGMQISKLNAQITTLGRAINLLRSYTPQGYQSNGTSPNTIHTDQAPWNVVPTAKDDLVTIMEAVNSNGLNQSGLFVQAGSTELDTTSISWDTAASGNSPYRDTFSQSGMNALGQSLQAISTQLTTQVQTLTAQASQTTEMSNTMSQAASSVLANMMQMYLATAKA